MEMKTDNVCDMYYYFYHNIITTVIIITISVPNILDIPIGELYRCSEFGMWIKISFAVRGKFSTGEIILYSWYHGRNCRKTVTERKM